MTTTPQWQQPSVPSPTPPPSRPWYRKKRVLIPAGLLVLAGVGSAISDPGETATPSAAPISTSTGSASAEASVTATPTPPSTPSTHTTSAPASSSAAPAPETETPVVDPYSERFGTFATIDQSGSGDSVIQLPAEAEAALITSSHQGSANFVLQTLDGSNQMSELLVNQIGTYSGTVPYGLTGSESGMLQITADGAWTVTISPIASAPLASAQMSGTGDAVYRYEGEAAVAAFTHDGSANFVVQQSDGSWPSLLINEIGAYEGSVPVMAGPSLLVITADGSWTVTTS